MTLNPDTIQPIVYSEKPSSGIKTGNMGEALSMFVAAQTPIKKTGMKTSQRLFMVKLSVARLDTPLLLPLLLFMLLMLPVL